MMEGLISDPQAPNMKTDDTNLKKLAFAMTIMFFCDALWEQFAPKATPGVQELARAQVLMASGTAADKVEACKLFGAAVREGNKQAAFGLSDCIGARKEGTEEARRALRYAVLTIALDAPKGARDAAAERAALGCTPEEIAEANKIDVVQVLLGEMSPTDYMFSAWSN